MHIPSSLKTITLFNTALKTGAKRSFILKKSSLGKLPLFAGLRHVLHSLLSFSMTQRMPGSALIVSLLFMPSMASAQLNVFACEPEWAALTRELGGDRVDVYSATTARQDPHYVQARPSLIAKMRRADLLVCSGAELEVGCHLVSYFAHGLLLWRGSPWVREGLASRC